MKARDIRPYSSCCFSPAEPRHSSPSKSFSRPLLLTRMTGKIFAFCCPRETCVVVSSVVFEMSRNAALTKTSIQPLAGQCCMSAFSSPIFTNTRLHRGAWVQVGLGLKQAGTVGTGSRGSRGFRTLVDIGLACVVQGVTEGFLRSGYDGRCGTWDLGDCEGSWAWVVCRSLALREYQLLHNFAHQIEGDYYWFERTT